MPQDIIRRRPDIRLAERQLAAQSTQIGYAITDLYPQISIGGAIGSSAMNSGDLFKSDSETFNLFGMFQWNIFNYGRLRSNVRLQDALFQQLLVDYRNTVISNLQSLAQQQDLLSSTQGSVATNLVNVYKALGGGWEIRDQQDPVDLLPEATRKQMLNRIKAWDSVLK